MIFASLPGVFDNPRPCSLQIGGLHPDGLRWELQPGRTLRYSWSGRRRGAAPVAVLKVVADISTSLVDAALRREAVTGSRTARPSKRGVEARAAFVDQGATPHTRILVGYQAIAGFAAVRRTPSARACRRWSGV